MPAVRIVLSYLLLLTVALSGGQNRVRSSDFATKKQRLEVLKKFIHMRSIVEDAVYDIFDVNMDANSALPGPTHRDFRIALVVKKADSRKWLTDVTLTSFPHDAAWCHALLGGSPVFAVRHKADVWTYTSKNKTAFYFDKDNILCLRIYQD